MVEVEGWRNELTMIRISVAKIWTNPDNRPDNFDGRIIPANMESLNDPASNKDTQPLDEHPADMPKEIADNKPTDDLEPVNEQTNIPAEEEYTGSNETPADYDLMDFLPSVTDFLNDDQTAQPDDKIETNG